MRHADNIYIALTNTDIGIYENTYIDYSITGTITINDTIADVLTLPLHIRTGCIRTNRYDAAQRLANKIAELIECCARKYCRDKVLGENISYTLRINTKNDEMERLRYIRREYIIMAENGNTTAYRN